MIAALCFLAAPQSGSAAMLVQRSDIDAEWSIRATPNATGAARESWSGTPGFGGIENQNVYRYVSAHYQAHDSYAAVRVNYDSTAVRIYGMAGAGPGMETQPGVSNSLGQAEIVAPFWIAPEPGEEIGQSVTIHVRSSVKYFGSTPPGDASLFWPGGREGAIQTTIGANFDENFVVTALQGRPGTGVAVSAMVEFALVPTTHEAPSPLHPRSFRFGGNAGGDVLLPTSINPGSMQFVGVPSGGWFDPPFADGFRYVMDSASLFTAIEAFPLGYGDAFTISVAGVTLPVSFAPGDVLDFSDWSDLLGELLIDGHGVRSFELRGISPLVDPNDELAFPLKLAFSTPTADFRMIAVPEPSAASLWAIAIPALFVSVRRVRLAHTPTSRGP